jgi:preprotein translocase subunit YajC
MGAIVILILLALLWVVLIVPRQREVRRHNALVSSLHVGDEVMSGAGIYGTITAMGDDEVSLEIAPGVIIKMAKRAVGSRIDPVEASSDDTIDDGDADTDEDESHGDEATSDDLVAEHTNDDGSAADAAELHPTQIDRTED